MVDPFVIYNSLYSVLRECVSGAMYGKQLQQLTESTEVETAIGYFNWVKVIYCIARHFCGCKFSYKSASNFQMNP